MCCEGWFLLRREYSLWALAATRPSTSPLVDLRCTGLGALAMWLAAGSTAQLLAARGDSIRFALLYVVAGFDSTWLATIFWNLVSQRCSARLCGQLNVSETLFALLYSFALDGRWPTLVQFGTCGLFTLSIVAFIQARRYGALFFAKS